MYALNPDVLREIFEYDPGSGHLMWKHARGKRPAGAVAGTKRKDNGYLVVSVKQDQILVHRIAYAIHHGVEVSGHIDHINGNPSDNRIANLRLGTARENHQNHAAHRAGRLPGASQIKSTGRWQARISVEGRSIHLGTFETEQDAHAAYLAAAATLKANGL